MKKIPVIYDGDMGGDDLWAIAIMLAAQDRFDLRGIASVFGNVSQPFAARNCLNFLHWLGQDGLDVFQGTDLPYDGIRPFGDDAYGSDGVGGVALPQSPRRPVMGDIAHWYNTQLCASPEPVTIIATGPITNIAHFIVKYPQNRDKIREIIWMGGGIDVPGRDGKPVLLENGDKRAGNITPYAEFNAYQDPKSLNIVLQSGVRCIFMAADATQLMVLDPVRQQRVASLPSPFGPAFHRMLMVVADLDMEKFGLDGPCIHDPNVITYLLRPDLYDGIPLPDLAFTESTPEDPRRGQAVRKGTGQANAFWLNHVRDTEAVFALMLENLEKIIARAQENRSHPAG